MKLTDYIQGSRKGKEAHRLEKESMKDPFLADAMDGYSQVEGNHEIRIEQLKQQIANKSMRTSSKRHAITWSIAACLLLGIGISSYFLLQKQALEDSNQLAQKTLPPTTTLPDSFSTLDTNTEKHSELAKATSKETSTPAEQSSVKSIIPTIPSISVEQNDEDEMKSAESYMSKDSKITSVENISQNKDLIAGNDTKREKAKKDSATELYNDIPTVAIAMQSSHKKVAATKENAPKASSHSEQLNDQKRSAASPIAKPEPVIGDKKFQKYLKQNLVHPVNENGKSVKGEVIVRFLIDSNGRPTNLRIQKSLCESADKEAIRLIKEGPDWTPANHSGEISVKF